MTGPRDSATCMGLVCDANSATLLAVRDPPRTDRTGQDLTLSARRCVEFEPHTLKQAGRLPALEVFVTENQLAGCSAHVAFVGAAAVVEMIRLPPLSARRRQQAIRTRLASYLPAASGDLTLDLRPAAKSEGSTQMWLAAGVECGLTRGVWRACKRAGLQVECITALAGSVPVPGAPDAGGVVAQLLLGERTTTIQLFREGHLLACREILLGRHDFVGAYQRPILTESGAITLSAAEAEALCQEVGVPVGREDEVRPGVRATQLWPTLNPVLQKLRNEVAQSLSHHQLADARAAISVLGAPVLVGLGEFLADELQLAGPLLPAADAQSFFLASLVGNVGCESGIKDRGTRTSAHSPRSPIPDPHAPLPRPLDLRPPEERLADRLTRPALAAGLCAALIIFANSTNPQYAQAQISQLRPAATQLQMQVAEAQRQRAAAQAACSQLAEEISRRNELARVLPATPPVVALLKEVLGTLPPQVELLDVQLHAPAGPTFLLDLRASYQGQTAASVVAAQWARRLADSAYFQAAKVTAVGGSGQQNPALMALQATLK